MSQLTAPAQIASFSFMTTCAEMNSACSGFDYNSIEETVTGRTEVRIEWDADEQRLEGVVIENGGRFGHVFEPVEFGTNDAEYDVEFLNELYDLSNGTINPRY